MMLMNRYPLSADVATNLCADYANSRRMGFRTEEMARSWLKAYFEGRVQ